MKRVLLICPDQRPSLEPITGGVPLALAVYLGKPLIEHALDGLAKNGVTHVRLLASDRPAEVRAYVQSGTAWGVEIEIVPESTELSPEQAAERHAAFATDGVMTLDSLPQAPHVPVLADAAAWHSSRATLLPLLAAAQVGAREISPGVWLGLRARVEESAVLHAPCWVGPHSIVRSQAVVGPHGYVESDSLVDTHAVVEDSTVGARTYLGSMTHLASSVAAGPHLLNWGSGSLVRMTDAFLLSPLDPPHEAASSLPARALALLLLVLTSPLLLLAFIAAVVSGKAFVQSHTAALPVAPGNPPRSARWHSLPALPGRLSRWPMLWRVATGHFAWTGNPPLTPAEATAMQGEFERLWLSAAPGIFTAPEAEGCAAPWDDAARAHAALFACQATSAWRSRILRHGLQHLFS